MASRISPLDTPSNKLKEGSRGSFGGQYMLCLTAAILMVAAYLALSPQTTEASAAPSPQAQQIPAYVPNQVVVKYKPQANRATRTAVQASAGVIRPQITASRTRLLKVQQGQTVAGAVAALNKSAKVEYAVPNFVAKASAETPTAFDTLIPNDPGKGTASGDWQKTQWNFLAKAGINAPGAWANLAKVGKPGGQGVKIAVLDTGVAYRSRYRLPRSPDLKASTFVRGYDFVDRDPYPNDFNGHGTHVASTIAEASDNGYGLTGVAYGAQIMPVRVLDRYGAGDAVAIARGIRFAAKHGAQIINLSLEFNTAILAIEIPEIISAISYAHKKGAIIVGAAGNEAENSLAYPAKDSDVIAVGATTEHLCVADYSNHGRGLDIVAPGGGLDAYVSDPSGRCNPEGKPGRDIFQVTFSDSPRVFGMPSGYEGTSMAAPHVSGVIALTIASGVIGPNPTQSQVLQRLRQTARDLGVPGRDPIYGSGLIDAAAATAPAAAP